MQIFFMYSFTELKSNHSVFASNFEIIRSNFDKKLLMLHVCSIFVLIMIKMLLPLILNGKNTDKALFWLYEYIYFICVTYLIDLGLI